MKKIRITSGDFKGQEFEIENYLYLDNQGKLWNKNTHLAEALPGDIVTFEARENINHSGMNGMFIGHRVEVVLEPTNYQVCITQDAFAGHRTHVWTTDELWGLKVKYNRENTAEYV